MNHHRGGFTLVEALISVSLLSIVLGSFVTLSYQTLESKKAKSDSYSMEMELLDALADIRRDLRRSGYTATGGGFPVAFDAEDVGDVYPEFDHAAAAEHPDGDAVNQDLVMLLPADMDGNGWPDYDGNGNPVWGGDMIAYTLVPDGNGTNTLVRTAGQLSTDVARRVSRAIFDTSASSGFTIPLDCVRLRLEVARYDGTNLVASMEREIIVQLRNGD